MVGATLAALLGGQGCRVAVVEGSEPRDWSPEEPPDLRVSSVNAASRQVFKACDAWAGMVDRRAAPFRRLRAWDASGRGETSFHAADAGAESFGHFVENRIIQLALWERLAVLDNVHRYCPAEPASLETDAEGAVLRLRDGRSLGAALLVGADGARSAIRRMAGIDMDFHEYGQHALIINAVTRLPQQDITWQCFTPNGPRAFLPLAGHHASLVWYDSPNTVRRLLALPDESLVDAVHDAFPAELGGIEAIIGRGSFPIRRGHARRYHGNRVALVGDAAHVIHPLAGQGLNLGIQDARELATRIQRAVTGGRDVGAVSVLAAYEARRRPANLAMMLAMDAFHRVFTAALPGVRHAGALGLGLANQLAVAKRLVMRHAMGLGPVSGAGR